MLVIQGDQDSHVIRFMRNCFSGQGSHPNFVPRSSAAAESDCWQLLSYVGATDPGTCPLVVPFSAPEVHVSANDSTVVSVTLVTLGSSTHPPPCMLHKVG
jgi:hypothetical protein